MPDATSDPVGIDPNRASVARVYDALLGGKDNYEIDREVAAQLDQAAPAVATIARDSRAWLGRVTRHLAGVVGIDQFLDCGSGLPTAENTHQIASRANRDSCTVYVDHDPVVAAHGQVLLADNASSYFLNEDMGQVDRVLSSEPVVQHLDFDRPIALLVVATLHNLPAAYDPHVIMRQYIDALPSGSYVVLNHLVDPDDGSEVQRMAHELVAAGQGSSMGSGKLLTPAEIAKLFGPCELVEPGVVPPAQWWPDGPLPEPLPNLRQMVLGGVARKP